MAICHKFRCIFLCIMHINQAAEKTEERHMSAQHRLPQHRNPGPSWQKLYRKGNFEKFFMKNLNSLLTNRPFRFTITTTDGGELCFILRRRQRFCGKRGGRKCSSVMSPRGDSLSASEWSILAVRPDRLDHGFFSIVCGADGGIFIPIFQQQEKGGSSYDNA